MARKHTDVSELARALKTPAFTNRDSGRDGLELDPISPTTLVLKVSQIKPYEHNPRHADNPEYPRLKDSIRMRGGLTTPLTVTKRPAEDLYTIAAGGNSRLRALKELAEETGDDAFERVTCRFEPWDSECRTLANHLIENDVRGNILFADKARAITEWWRLFRETNPDEPPLSQRMLADRLADAGYRVPQSLLSRLLYAAEHLIPYLPKAFGSGLGRRHVEELIRLRTYSLQYWRDTAGNAVSSADAAFDALFAETCARHDCHCEEWDCELFQSALTIGIANELKIDHKLVALDIDTLYHGYSVPSSDAGEARTSDPHGLKSEWAFERAREIETAKAERAKARLEARAQSPSTSPTGGQQAPAPVIAGEQTSVEAAGVVGAEDPQQLRENNYAAALRLAQDFDLAPFVQPSKMGFGFFVDAPAPPRSSPAQARANTSEGVVLTGRRSALWWVLCLLADELASDHLSAIAKSYPKSWIVELFAVLPKLRPETDPLAALHLLVGEPTARSLIWDLFSSPSLAPADMGALSELFEGCRALRAAAEEGSLALWEPES